MTGKPGWWETMVGPGKPIDTDRFFVICPNVLGGCMGSTGPASINPTTGKPWGLDFPVITIGDMVDAQVPLIDHLGIDQLFCVIGGSMGGMQVLEWAARHGEPRLHRRADRHRRLAFLAEHRLPRGRPAGGDGRSRTGRRGATSSSAWSRATGSPWRAWPRTSPICRRRRCSASSGATCRTWPPRASRFNADFQVESYLRHQGSTFVDRFDANSYLYITRAIDYFDLAAEHGDVLANAFKGTKTRFCVVSFTSDWLYPTRESREIVQALNAVAANVSFVEIESDKGHDAFLLDEPELFATIRGFLNAAAEKRGLKPAPERR